MTDATRLMPADEQTRRQIRSAQALSVLDGIVLSLTANSFLAATTAAVLWLDEPGAGIFFWLAAVVAVNLARYIGVRIIHRLNCAVERPERALGILSLGALSGGLVWSLSPFLGAAHSMNGLNPYLIFIIGGICAGALMQSTAYARTALFFSAPPLAAAFVSLIVSGATEALVIAADALLLAVMMLRASQLSEASFIRSQIDRLKAMALAVSLSDANAEIRQSYDKLATMANRDPLTGLGNRALFNQRLRSLLDDGRGNTGPLALLAIDLDRFKAINDTGGHVAGDELLRQLSTALRRQLREGDTLARIGGDEFAVLLENTPAAHAACVARKLIAAVEGFRFAWQGFDYRLGASAGLVEFSGTGLEAEDVLEAADRMCYVAKESGRGCVAADVLRTVRPGAQAAHTAGAALSPVPATGRSDRSGAPASARRS